MNVLRSKYLWCQLIIMTTPEHQSDCIHEQCKDIINKKKHLQDESAIHFDNSDFCCVSIRQAGKNKTA